MKQYFNLFVTQVKGFMESLSPVKRMSVILSVITVIVTIVLMVIMLSGKSFVPLFTKINPDQLPLVVDKLKKMNVPFRVIDGGDEIRVPPELLHSTQMAIMTEHSDGQIGSMGLEIFDNVDLGTTSYAQRINFQRALQGELMRAINSLSVVKRSKVILALPPKKTFLEEGSDAKASVVVDLHSGSKLTKNQVKGIVNLVSSAVENLHPNNVSIVDSHGRVLGKANANDNTLLSGEMLEMKEMKERELEEKIESILGRAVGSSNIIAKVDATLNMDDTSIVSEDYNPDKTAVRSVQQQNDLMNGSRRNPAGIPGARANLPGAEENEMVGFNQETNKEFANTHYEVPKTVTRSRKAPGAIEKISVAVMVDGKEVSTKGENGEIIKDWAPRTAEELQKYEALIKSAVGFNAERGDVVKIENVQFQKEDFSDADEILHTIENRKLISYVVRWSIVAAALALFFLLVVRPFISWITDSFQESVDDMLPRTIEELEELQSVDSTLPGMSGALPVLEESVDPDKAESELLKERIMGLMEKDEEKSASALKLWLVRKEL